MSPFQSSLATERGWVDPLTLPKYGDASEVAGNAPDDTKQLTLNTLGAYGVGDADCFAYAVGRQIRIADMNTESKGDKMEVVVVSEVQVTKEMLNGAGLMHGGCLCYLIDNCAAFPLVALGVMQNTNGVGVTQALNIFFHAPASLQTCMRITSTSVTLGGRIMTSRCEVTDKASGRMIASALLGKMQPKL
ncbi:HotDog domain-containing protein [Ganoderma leucocontextum]|nr:HotDog domain-containing protein [Ganoderma leucocontextum]